MSRTPKWNLFGVLNTPRKMGLYFVSRDGSCKMGNYQFIGFRIVDDDLDISNCFVGVLIRD